ncbi:MULTISPECIES: GNAT family N-acetyltransferase [unclassified Pseudomonas]|uniref:GNAT family N-acetyltransferase n=1 Tax=unclassified Pseudomonas TaxID=196821 RepID=UPI002AC8E2CA|nr:MULTISPECIES: GNAT family N-acetyltransferase [unclassified Pseudomonas]MEB0047180.1 GNAT family N-acetyltransferase [Pseudomonas sp. Dout3]MEB0096768.1 GNAT family N-acetyltransferase [Pseudomonas sp. DC1.2]WPX57286.1 GNAT family N-acetyltransferase [Pseudomonas sp. DC1.2]
MSDLNYLSVLTLPSGRRLGAEKTQSRLHLSLEGQPLVDLHLSGEPEWQVQVAQSFGHPEDLTIWSTCYWLFAHDRECQHLDWRLDEAPTEALLSGLLIPTEGVGEYRCERTLFWQLPQPWLGPLITGNYPQQRVISGGKGHPLRPVKPRGEVYRRFDTRLGAWVSLRTVDIEQDLERFNRWQNSPRVASFWAEEGSLEKHREYLSTLAADPHTLMLIGCFDDQPFAYFEAYWVKEDRLAPFYDAGDYDRGIHMLVGEETHRGPHKVASWLSALVHYLFLDDSRTQRVVAEPRADNARMIGHLHNQCFHCEKEFDFPHKRAALMVLGRERFFDRCPLA